MRIGSGKIIQKTSGDWQPDSVGAPVLAQSSRFMQIRATAIKLADALDLLRDAFRQEADDEGPWTQAILDTQEHVRDALAGCGAMMVEMKEKD